jgi:hypothetical protein
MRLVGCNLQVCKCKMEALHGNIPDSESRDMRGGQEDGARGS